VADPERERTMTAQEEEPAEKETKAPKQSGSWMTGYKG